MLFIVGSGQKRPNMISDEKDVKYHTDFARYFIGEANNTLHTDFLEKIRINKEFYKNNQWMFDEDLEAFFKDETGNERNRLKFTKNLIRPMVEQYRGNAIRMQINAKLKSVSPKAVSRREEKLEKMLFFSRVANEEGNPFGPDMRKQLPIGGSESETREIFDNLYVDRYVETMNDLLVFVSERNKFASRQVKVAEDMALAGKATMKTHEYAGHQVFEQVEPEFHFWDRSASKYDLSDAEYQGEIHFWTPSEIFERAKDLTGAEREAIVAYAENYGQNKSTDGVTTNKYFVSGRVPVYETYWKDTDKFEYGYVMDEFGYPYCTKINFTYEGEDEPRYTDKDLIEVKSAKAKKLLKGELKRNLFVDTLRYAIMIPSEVIAPAHNDGISNKAEAKDIVFEWGVYEYQEADAMDLDSVQFPYKSYCWGYLDGVVLSPIDDAISPQRFINRIMSVAENQVNNSGGSGPIYDSSVVDPQGGESELLRNMNMSRPVKVNAKMRGIQNVVGQYDTGIKQGTMVLFNIMDVMKNHMQDVTGINEGLKGESTGSDQLVGVTQLMIQRGSLMQEPFYNAIAEVFLQCYQSVATTGKQIYADNERELSMAVGDNGYKMLKITKDMKTEVFRTFVKRENTDEMLVNAGNQMLLAFMAQQIIDKEQFSALFGHSSPDEIASAIRFKARTDKEVARIEHQAEQEEEQAMAAAAEAEQSQMQNMMFEQEAKADIQDLGNKRHELKMVYAKQLGALAKTDPAARGQVLQKTKNLEDNLV